MFEIRFYYKNQDKNNNKKVVFHPYERYESYEEACEGMEQIKSSFEILGAIGRVFLYSIEESEIENKVLALDEEGKDLAVIIKV